MRIRHKQGHYCWLYERGLVLRDEQGQVRRVIGQTVDITERKQVEEQLRASHDTFRQLVENSPFGIYVVDADFRLARVGAGAQKVFENVRPLIGRDFAEVLRVIWPEPFASEAIGCFRYTLNPGEPYHAPSTVERRYDISEVEAYDWKIERITLPDGRFGVVCHFYDLSERSRYEAALRESEERMRLVLNASKIGIWILDVVRWHGYWSVETCQIFGVDEFDGKVETFQSLVHPADVEAFWMKFNRTLEKGGTFQTEFRIIRPNGETRWVGNYGHAEYDAEGKPLRFLGTVFDITERKRAEESQQLLAEVSRLLTTSLNGADQLEAAAELLVESFADWCVLNSLAADETIHLSVAEHHEPEKTTLIYEFVQAYPLSSTEATGTAEAIRTEQAKLYNNFLAGMPAERAQDPIYRQYLDKLGSGSTLIAPLIARGQTFGSITLARAGFRRPFDQVDLALAQELTYRMAIALDNSFLYQAERAARLEAEAAQKSLAFLAETRERNRLAQELHDTVAQALGYLNLKISIAHASPS